MRQIDRVKKGRRRRAALVLVAVVIAGAGVLWALASWEVRDAEVEFPPIGRFLTVEGTRLHYVCRGEGRPVMLLHGNPGFVQDYSAVFERLRPDYRVCALDRPGHGYSSRLAEEGGDPRSQARLVHAAARKLGLERPLLVVTPGADRSLWRMRWSTPRMPRGSCSLHRAPTPKREPRLRSTQYRRRPWWATC